MKKVKINEESVNHLHYLISTQSCAQQDWDSQQAIDAQCQLAEEMVNAERRDGCIIVSDEVAELITGELYYLIDDIATDLLAGSEIDDSFFQKANITLDALNMAFANNGVYRALQDDNITEEEFNATVKKTINGLLEGMVEEVKQ